MQTIPFPPAVRRAILRLEERGFSAYAVGGCVRDSLRGVRPADWDLATAALPREVGDCFAGCRVIESGVAHGTVTVLWEDMTLEITTYRAETTYQDHRHPDAVRFSSRVEEDLARRDFTVNAMACRPGGAVLDPYGGRKDLEAGLLRCVGDPRKRFEEDGLRMMRALRFCAALGFALEDETGRALREKAPLLRLIAPERLCRELDGLLAGKNAGPVLGAYGEVLAVFMPEMIPMLRLGLWEHAAKTAAAAKGDPALKLAALLHDLGKPSPDGREGFGPRSAEIAGPMLRRLRYDRKTIDTVCFLLREQETAPLADEAAVGRWLSRTGEGRARQLIALWRAEWEARNLPPGRTAAVEKILDRLVAKGACCSLRQLAVNGGDLAAAGIPPGKEMGNILRALLHGVIDGVLPNEPGPLLERAKQLWDRYRE